jgi:ABC-type antimicrobial peptide transport system permease subunit
MLARTIESQLAAVDRAEPVFDVRSMEERLSISLAPARFHLVLIGSFAVVSIVLACCGIHGVMSYLVALRTREIGIRMAMGASVGAVLRLVLGESVTLTAIAMLAGLGGGWALTRYVKSMLYGITALDTPTFLVMPCLLAAIAIAASFIPAKRAAQVDPVSALREQ